MREPWFMRERRVKWAYKAERRRAREYAQMPIGVQPPHPVIAEAFGGLLVEDGMIDGWVAVSDHAVFLNPRGAASPYVFPYSEFIAVEKFTSEQGFPVILLGAHEDDDDAVPLKFGPRDVQTRDAVQTAFLERRAALSEDERKHGSPG